MNVKISDSKKESTTNKNISHQDNKIKTKYFINKNFQRFISIIYYLIGFYFLYFLLCFLISIYVSIIYYNIN